jgi:hypothetical protein
VVDAPLRAESVVDAACRRRGVDLMNDGERAALARRVRPSVLQLLSVHGKGTAAFVCAMRYVATDADCTCGAGHVHRGSYWNHLGWRFLQAVPES